VNLKKTASPSKFNNNTIIFASGLEFPRFFPGPMEGVMTPWFCRTFHCLNLTAGWLTPYYRLTTSLPRDSRLKKFLAPFMENNLPVIVQLMGTNPDLIASCAKRMVYLGAAGINLNFACPSNQVLRSGTGGALLKDLPLMLEIIHTIKAKLPNVPLSVKIRNGFDSPAECDNIIPELVKTGALDFIAVHFRTVMEKYCRVPNGVHRLRHAAILAEEVPLIGSGDIFCLEDAMEMLENGCEGVIAARGILRNPFLLSQLLDPENSPAPSEEQGRILFFQNLQKTARQDFSLFRRSKLLEYAAMMWGSQSATFKQLKDIPPDKLLKYHIGSLKDS
jgi:tRNA-dihydrouridine synthase C